MAILYALVARGTVLLAEFSSTTTTASAIAKQIQEKIPGNDDSHVSYSQDVFHIKRTDGLTILCRAEETAGTFQKHSMVEKLQAHVSVDYTTVGDHIHCDGLCLSWTYSTILPTLN